MITRENNRSVIERELSNVEESVRRSLHFRYHDLPRWARKWKSFVPLGVQIYYACWQRSIVRLATSLHQEVGFDLVQHITFGVWRQPSLLYRLGIPFAFGPVGGGEAAPWALERGFSVEERVRSILRRGMNLLALWNPWLRQCLRRSILVISKTPETSAWITRAGGKSVPLIEIGIDASTISPRPSVADDTPRPLRCIFAGRLIGQKGVHLAVEAIAKACAQGTDATLTIIGHGPMRGPLEALAGSLGVQHRVRFVDWLAQPDLFAQYRQHDLLLFPSLQDSSGNVILEAFAHGLAVVCLALGGPATLVDSSCGWPVQGYGKSRDEVTTELAAALVALDARRDRLAALCRGARKKALSTTWDAVVKQAYGLLPAS